MSPFKFPSENTDSAVVPTIHICTQSAWTTNSPSAIFLCSRLRPHESLTLHGSRCSSTSRRWMNWSPPVYQCTLLELMMTASSHSGEDVRSWKVLSLMILFGYSCGPGGGSLSPHREVPLRREPLESQLTRWSHLGNNSHIFATLTTDLGVQTHRSLLKTRTCSHTSPDEASQPHLNIGFLFIHPSENIYLYFEP